MFQFLAPILVFLPLSDLSAHHSPAGDDWPRYGHDASLTGRSPMRGEIEAPHVAWSFSLAGRELLLELEPSPGTHRVNLSAESVVDPGPARIRAAEPLRLDVEGLGVARPVQESFHERWAKILPNVAGLQRVAWNQTWTDQKVCRLQLFAYDQGFDRPRLVWESDPPEATVFNPLNVVFDIDGDGVQEICSALHYRVIVFEGTTGRKETELRYHSCRPYGWFGLSDVDADGQMELVTLGDFQSHLDVLEFDPKRPEGERLSVKWRRDIETNIDERAKWPQVGPYPLADVTGDGRPEIVASLFNDTGDGQWHAVAWNAVDGSVALDFARRFLQGVADVDGDGRAELFLASTNGVLVKTFGSIELVGLRDGKPAVLWSRSDAAWLTADVPRFGPTWSTTAAQGMRHVLLQGGGRPAFFVCAREATEPRRTTLSALRFAAAGSPELLWEIAGMPANVEALAADPLDVAEPASVLVRAKLAVNESAPVTSQDVRARIRESRPHAFDTPPPIAARLELGEGMSVIAEGPGQQVAVISPPLPNTAAPRLRWQRPGRGMRDGSRVLGLLAADLNGDGGCEVIAADRSTSGHAMLIAYRGDGTTLWQRSFDEIPGGFPQWNVGALTFWWAGRLRQPDAIDVVVNTRRGLMHSDVGQLVDGRDGTTVWKLEKAVKPGEFHWGWGGAPLAAADVVNDQRDELICLYPVCFWIADGRDGSILFGKELASRKTLPAWAAYGEPIVHDFQGDGVKEVLLDSPYLLALLDASGRALWHGLGRADYPVSPREGNVGETTACKHALIDIDGDGQFEIASAGYGNGVRVIDHRSGKTLWSLAAPSPTGPKVAVANIDGHGGDEILYPSGTTLVAVTGDHKSGRILWTWQAPAALSMPAIADIDGDSLAEIIVQDAAATVHCLDAAKPARASRPIPNPAGSPRDFFGFSVRGEMPDAGGQRTEDRGRMADARFCAPALPSRRAAKGP